LRLAAVNVGVRARGINPGRAVGGELGHPEGREVSIRPACSVEHDMCRVLLGVVVGDFDGPWTTDYGPWMADIELRKCG
jgi:hypothetical protein